MPIARLQKRVKVNGTLVVLNQPCVLLREGKTWTALDPENNNELIKGASTDFIRKEIAAERLCVEQGWDLGVRD